MIRRFALALLAVAAVSFVAAPAQAGGSSGGTKRSVSIKTYNQSGADVIVIPMTNSQYNNDANWPTTVSQAKSSKWGGVQIADGSSKTVKAPGGQGYLTAATFDPDTGELTPYGATPYNLSAGASTTASVNDAAPEVTIPRQIVN